MEKVPEFSTPATPFERFKDLAQKLVKVPKAELDAKLEEEKRRKSTPMVDVNAPARQGQ